MNLYRGENRIIPRSLFLADGTTELPVSSLVHLSVALYQGATLVATYVLGTDPELRAGDDTNELELEITSTLSLALALGIPLIARWTLKVSDADFEAEPDLFIDVQAEELFGDIL